MKRALFRTKLNAALNTYNSATKRLIAEHTPSVSSKIRKNTVLREMRMVNAGRSDGRGFSQESLQAIVNSVHSPSASSIALLHSKKGEAVREIEKQSKLRKSFPRGTIRLISTGRKVKVRLKRKTNHF